MSSMFASKLPVTKQVTYSEVKYLMDSEGLTVKQVADRLDISLATLNKLLHEKGHKRLKWDEEAINTLKEMLSEGMTQAEIAEAFGTTRSNISNAIIRFGLVKNPRKKKAVCEEVKPIDVPELKEDEIVLDSDTWEKLFDDDNEKTNKEVIAMMEKTANEKLDGNSEPSTATAWLKPSYKAIYDGCFCSYMLDYKAGTVSVLADGKPIAVIERRDLLIFSREVMALEQLMAANEKNKE